MPRRKRTFIQRSKAHTYHVVRQPTSENPEHRVLVSDNLFASNTSDVGNEVKNGDLIDTYSARDFELGEFGFPDDGYDYSKHFREIGGGGGVYMSAATGLPDPDAVRSGISKPSASTASRATNDVVVLREDQTNEQKEEDNDSDDENVDDNPGEPTSLRDPQLASMHEKAMYELERDRQHNTDLDHVLLELETDEQQAPNTDANEDDIFANFGNDDGEDGHVEKVHDKEPEIPHETNSSPEQNHDDPSSESEEPDNYFDRLLNQDADELDENYEYYDMGNKNKRGSSSRDPHGLDGVKEQYREPRLLDAQFETFMRGFEIDHSSDDEDLAEMRRLAESEAAKETNEEDIFALLTENEKQGYAHVEVEDDALLGGLAELKLWDAEDESASKRVEGEGSVSDAPKSLQPTLTNLEGDKEGYEEICVDEEDEESVNRRKEVEGYREAEFERGMTGVLDSYQRIPVDEALEAADGLEGALRAIERQEKEELERLHKLDDQNIESDGHDSELDTLFDEQYNKSGELWDCETIISTYSNLDNHPSVIDAPCRTRRRPIRKPQSVIQLDPRTQAPTEFVPSIGAPAATRTETDFGSRRTDVSTQNVRPKGESKSDKKTRKTAVKEAARERRALKSEMKKAFGAEGVKQNKHSASLGNSKVAIRF